MGDIPLVSINASLDYLSKKKKEAINFGLSAILYLRKDVFIWDN